MIGVVDEGAVPSCCCAVLCQGLALGTIGGIRDIWTVGFVKDSVEHVGGVLSLSFAVRCDRAAHCFAIVVDAGQHSLLSYCTDLGLTAGVAC